jgi:predicted phosphodiesterase
MRYAVFSDVHANLPALDSFVEQTRSRVDAYICLGDVVNYGPWNDECLDLVTSLPGIVYLEGNHERLFRGAESASQEIPLVQAFFEHSVRSFTNREAIEGLPLQFETDGFCFTHTLDDQKIFADSDVTFSRNYFIGHSHHQFQIEQDGHSLINCGSVGQNRKLIDVLHYAIFDAATGEVELCESTFDFEKFMRELRARKYPQQCIDYYAKKSRRSAA